MKNEKAHQRNKLIYEYGILMQPLVDLAKATSPPTKHSYRIAKAKIQAGDHFWRKLVEAFARFAPDVYFTAEYSEISHVPEKCLAQITNYLETTRYDLDLDTLQEMIAARLEKAYEYLIQCIDRIPIEWEPVIFEANTPFTSYLRIKESLAVVKNRLHYFDRYLKPDFFPLFLESVGREVSIRLVTTAGKQHYGVTAVSAVSKLASQEFADFQLIIVTPEMLHDRNLIVDDQIFSLGPGVDRAGIALTNFGPADSSVEAHAEFDQILGSGEIVT